MFMFMLCANAISNVVPHRDTLALTHTNTHIIQLNYFHNLK